MKYLEGKANLMVPCSVVSMYDLCKHAPAFHRLIQQDFLFVSDWSWTVFSFTLSSCSFKILGERNNTFEKKSQ